MKLYLISDELTRRSLQPEAIELCNSWFRLSADNHPVLLVESAWSGYRDRWKYKIAAYPDHPRRNNRKLLRLLQTAKDKGIPTVFWNKEDAVHFDRFIESAKHFDHIFTVDENCVERYRAQVPADTTVEVAMFPVQPRIHNYQGFRFRHRAANFVGSYSSHIHDLRRERQHMLFSAAQKAGMPLTVFDRNSARSAAHYRYPARPFGLTVRPAVPYEQTAGIYRDFTVSLNVNTVEDSATMFSRRVVEILACGGILVSTPALSLETQFRDYCHIVHSEEEAVEILSRLKYGPTANDLAMAAAGADEVLNRFTWQKFLERIRSVAQR